MTVFFFFFFFFKFESIVSENVGVMLGLRAKLPTPLEAVTIFIYGNLNPTPRLTYA